MIEKYTTVKEFSARWGLKPRTVQIMCAEGRIEGVVKKGKSWAIPINAQKPVDKRLISGKYVNWRNIRKEDL